nr:purine permease [Propionibacterium sp.]
MSARDTTTAVAVRPEDERLSIGDNIIYGLQHILSMFGGVIAVPLIVGGAAKLPGDQLALLVASAIFISGIATVLQTVGVFTKTPFGFGSQLPLVQGISFASVSTLTSVIGKIGGVEGLRTALGSTIVAGIVAFLIVPFFAQVIRFFPPVVTGSIITVIGLSLMPAAGRWIAAPTALNPAAGAASLVKDGKIVDNPAWGNPNYIAIALITLAITLGLSMIPKLARMAILLGLALGTIVAVIWQAIDPAAKMINTPNFGGKSILAIPQPLAFGMPLFEIGAAISMFIVLVVVMVETTADILAVGTVVGTEVDAHRVANGLRADMLSCIVAPVFNTFPATAFAQNVGLVALSGIKSRWVVATGGAILAVLGLSPWLAEIIKSLPTPVLGGAGIVLFGMVAASGIRSLGKVNYDGNNNLLIVAVSIGFGLMPVVLPGFWHKLPNIVAVVLDSGISSAAIVAFLLNIVFNVWGKGDKSTVHVTEAHAPARAVTADDVEDLDK